MGKIRCMVVDDEPLAVEMLAGFIRRTPSLELAGVFTDPVTALSAISQQKPALVFLDIQMPDLNGLELSRLLPSETRVVFTTAFRQYAFESYEVEALDYLLKPIRYQKFIEAVAKAERWIGMQEAAAAQGTGYQSALSGPSAKDRKSAFIKVEGEYRNIDFDDILYVSGLKDYVMIHLESEKDPLVTHLTMKAVEEMLPADRFMRVHRSHIVALEKICAVDAYGNILLGKVTIPVSDTYRKDIDRYVQDHLLARR